MNNNASQTVNLVVEVNDLNVVLASLQELPHRVADPIIKKLVSQAQTQLTESTPTE